MLFKTADSAVASDQARTQVIGTTRSRARWCPDTSATPRGRTRSPSTRSSTVPFSASRRGRRHVVRPGTPQSQGPHSGVAVSFDTRVDRTVTMKVGISFVSIADARANLTTEIPGWNIDTVTRAATARWNDMLDRIRVGGGTASERSTFYSALYRSLLHPNVFDDVNGRYTGFDGRTHVATGYTQYANFSGWDVYRSEIPLLALIAAPETGDMIRSLLADHDQSGRLPKLAFTDVETAEMNGDSADPIIADAYAFGARGFDVDATLQAMVTGATTPGTGPGWDVERQDLDQYLARDGSTQRAVIAPPSTTASAGPRRSNTRSTTMRSRGSPTRSVDTPPPRRSWRGRPTGAISSIPPPATSRRVTRRADSPPDRVPTLTVTGDRSGGMGGGQLDPVHVERPARPARPVRPRWAATPWRWPSWTRSSRR